MERENDTLGRFMTADLLPAGLCPLHRTDRRARLAGPASAVTLPQPSKTRTVMVFIDGDNSLEGFVVKDVETELSVLGSNASVCVVCFADRGPGHDTSRGDWRTTKVYHCTQGMLANAASAMADWGERGMGDPQTFKDFVTWRRTNFPASNDMPTFWDHGYT